MFKYWDRAFRPFTARSIITLTIALSLLIQLIVLPYNHYTGYSRIDSLLEFVLSLFVNAIISSVAGIVVVLSDLYIIRFLNKRILWYGNDIKRILIQLFFTILIAISFSTFTTLFYPFLSYISIDRTLLKC